MTKNDTLFSLKTLLNSLNFVYPDFAWIPYNDHVYSNYDGLDISISIYHRDGITNSTSFLLNSIDKRFKFNDRDVKLLKNIDELFKQLTVFENLHNIRTNGALQISWSETIFGSTANKA